MDRIRTNGLFTTKSGDRAIAYVDLEVIRTLRRKHINRNIKSADDLHKLIANNQPVGLRAKKKLDRLRPAVDAEETYIIGMMLAMAQKQRQEHRRLERGAHSHSQEGERVCVIALPEAMAPVAYFYKAHIPVAFLNRLEYPREAWPCNEIVVKYTAVNLCNPEIALGRLIQLFSISGLLEQDS